ncbi:hypothetical protein [Verrucomicrobium sp. 3C]|uniref:hypothetical protein n=1 Tax=Verrucomicrobium sp. 3C TaxID=1134055 RepID=UPI00036B927C|nr:hypothetical protein [Verrucomicrobium sp. 3C]
MGLNRKLSSILHGRQIAQCEAAPDQLSLAFRDGSRLVVRLAAAAPPLPATGAIQKVLETGSRFVLVLESGPQVEIALADPGSSVSLRDRHGKVEYLG